MWINFEEAISKISNEKDILYDCTYMRYLKESNLLRKKEEWWLSGAGESGE